MQINVTFDSSVNNAPAAFTNAVNNVVQFYDALFTSPVTINIAVGYGEIEGAPIHDVGEERTSLATVPYSSVRNALIAEGAPGSNTLPDNAPTSLTLAASFAEIKALNLPSPPPNSIDGFVSFGTTSDVPWDFTGAPVPPNQTGAPVPPNEIDFTGVVEHELSEVMGRVSGLNGIATPGGLATGPSIAPADLFRYAAPEVRQFNPMGNPSYFSIDGGATNFGSWNDLALGAGDLADWAPLGLGGNISPTDAYGENVLGIAQGVSPNDIVLMNALGWKTSVPNTGPVFVLQPPPMGTAQRISPLSMQGTLFAQALAGFQSGEQTPLTPIQQDQHQQPPMLAASH